MKSPMASTIASNAAPMNVIPPVSKSWNILARGPIGWVKPKAVMSWELRRPNNREHKGTMHKDTMRKCQGKGTHLCVSK